MGADADRIATLIEALADDEARDAQLAELDDEALESLAGDLRAESDEYRERDASSYTDDDVARLQALRDAYQIIRSELEARATAAAERAEAANAALADIDATDAAEQPETELAESELVVTPPADETEPVAVETEAEPVAETEPEPVPVAAAVKPRRAVRRPSLAELAATKPVQPEPITQLTEIRPRWQTFDGSPLMSTVEIAERINAARESFVNAPPGFQDKVVVARLKSDLPSERMLHGDDVVADMDKLESVTAAGRDPSSFTEEQQAIVASGGWCTPRQPSWDIYNITSQDRPVMNGLPSMGVSRGGVTLVRADRLSKIITGGPGTSGAAISVWTNAIDTAPGGSTKQRQTMVCRTPINEDLQAIVARARFGNFEQRSFPELVADDVQLMMTAHARVAEVALMDKLIADMNWDVAQTGFFGTARDLKNHSMQIAANIHYLERSSVPIRAIITDVALPMIVHDIVAQTASGETAALEVDEGWARSLLASTAVNFVYSRDVSTGPETLQIATDGANLPDYPDNMEIPYFPDGSAVFLDGGRLDLGLVRDSTLNNTNDYELFVETFEGLAWLGPYGMTLTLTTCPNGKSQAASDVTTVCAGS